MKTELVAPPRGGKKLASSALASSKPLARFEASGSNGKADGRSKLVITRETKGRGGAKVDYAEEGECY